MFLQLSRGNPCGILKWRWVPVAHSAKFLNNIQLLRGIQDAEYNGSAAILSQPLISRASCLTEESENPAQYSCINWDHNQNPKNGIDVQAFSTLYCGAWLPPLCKVIAPYIIFDRQWYSFLHGEQVIWRRYWYFVGSRQSSSRRELQKSWTKE